MGGAMSTQKRLLSSGHSSRPAMTFGMLLNALGCEVQTCGDGCQAVDAACRFQPDVVFLDLGLPHKDGFVIAAEMRRTFGEWLRLVAVSGHGSEEIQNR